MLNFIRPLYLHLFLIFFGYSIILIPSFYFYNQISNSFQNYEEFIYFEKNIFKELINFQKNVLKKDDIEYIINQENIQITHKKYFISVKNIFSNYIKEINKFDVDKLDDDLIELNLKMQHINNYIDKIIENDQQLKNVDIQKQINSVIYMIYEKSNKLNYNYFEHYSSVNLEYYNESKSHLQKFNYVFITLFILFLISLYNWNKRRLLEKKNIETIIKYEMVFDACSNPILLINNNGEIFGVSVKLRNKMQAPKYYFNNINYNDFIKSDLLSKLITKNVNTDDFSLFEKTNSCEIITFKNENLKANYTVNIVSTEDGYLYLINFKNIK